MTRKLTLRVLADGSTRWFRDYHVAALCLLALEFTHATMKDGRRCIARRLGPIPRHGYWVRYDHGVTHADHAAHQRHVLAELCLLALPVHDGYPPVWSWRLPRKQQESMARVAQLRRNLGASTLFRVQEP